MNQLANLNYTFEELEVLKILAKFPNEPEKVENLLISGLNEYEFGRIKKILTKLHNDGIWDFDENYGKNGRFTFTIDFHDYILNYPNAIPDKIRNKINLIDILEKLSCSNLNHSEINYLTTLIKKDAISHF